MWSFTIPLEKCFDMPCSLNDWKDIMLQLAQEQHCPACMLTISSHYTFINVKETSSSLKLLYQMYHCRPCWCLSHVQVLLKPLVLQVCWQCTYTPCCKTYIVYVAAHNQNSCIQWYYLSLFILFI